MQSLPADERLKNSVNSVKPTHAHPNLPIRFGLFNQPYGIDTASWIADDIHTRLTAFKQQATIPTIAILAPKWDDFNAIQHYLEQLSINSQRYNESEQLIPLNPHCQNSCHPYLNNLNGGKGDNHGTIQCRTQTSNTKQTTIA